MKLASTKDSIYICQPADYSVAAHYWGEYCPGVPFYGGRHRQKWHGMEALPCISDKLAYFSQFLEGDIAFKYTSCYNQTMKNLCSLRRKTLLVCVQIIGLA